MSEDFDWEAIQQRQWDMWELDPEWYLRIDANMVKLLKDDLPALLIRVEEMEAEITALRQAESTAPHRCENGEIFVCSIMDPDCWKRARKAPFRDGLTTWGAIRCSRCDNPAVQLDCAYPAGQRDTLCQQHVSENVIP